LIEGHTEKRSAISEIVQSRGLLVRLIPFLFM